MKSLSQAQMRRRRLRRSLLRHPACIRQVRLRGVKRTYSESTALPNSPGVSSGSGVKRAHDEGIVNDDEEQPGTRARISTLIAGLHGVDVAEDDELVK